MKTIGQRNNFTNGRLGEDEDDHDVATVTTGKILAKTVTNSSIWMVSVGFGLILIGGLIALGRSVRRKKLR